MIDAELLLSDTKKEVIALVDDLRSVVATDPQAAAHVAAEYTRAHAAGRTAFGQSEWAEGLYAQVAVAWVLGCVFVRFCEDNELIDDPLLGGPGIRGQIARDHRAAHLQANPADDDRHWLREVFARLRSLPATGEIFGLHNPVWIEHLLPSADGARKLRDELTSVDPETGELRHDFTDPAWDTRFLGDLYQDLSEHAKKTYALLQTPVFVEEFILDRTLEPAIATFGLADTTIIDPTCGSGHFLLGAFARLVNRWVELEPSTNGREIARRALSAIGGIDLNPFAASIARFRLLLAALRVGGDKRLADAPAYEIEIAVGDSLLHGDPPGALPGLHSPGEEEELVSRHGYESEEVEAVRLLLSRQWAAVVGNPPYITVKDPALNAAYRGRFSTCSGKYSLGVPFTQRFWQLARAGTDPERAGYIGLITANSFMKREMGKKLIEEWLPANDLAQVIDTSGAYIPGHGTPTVILVGRNRAPVGATVRTVMGTRGEPARPSIPERGSVWSSIVQLVDTPGAENEWVSVVDLERQRLLSHPWSIGGGGAFELKQRLDEQSVTIASVVDAIGFHAITGQDEFFLGWDESALRRSALSGISFRALASGECIRDWSITASELALFPYTADLSVCDGESLHRAAWPYAVHLDSGLMFGKTRAQRGLAREEYAFFSRERDQVPLSIAYASVASGNHFVLDHGGRVFKQSAPVMKLPVGSSESRHLELLSVLNSSTGCFWIRQTCHDKGNRGEGGGITSEGWERFHDLDGTKLKQFPLPSTFPIQTAARLNELGAELVATSPGVLVTTGVPTAAALDAADRRTRQIRAEMTALQEQLDWECYKAYGLVEDELSLESGEPSLTFGERAFEIVLARQIARGEEQSAWFSRNDAVPRTELPNHWTDEYRTLVERRIALIESDRNIGLIERAENKRRWNAKPWDDEVRVALESWLLDRLGSQRYWPTSAMATVARLAAEARSDNEFVSVSRLYAGRDDVDIAQLIARLVDRESVAFLAAYRYSESGLRKHESWLRTWDLQRRSSPSENVGALPVPPTYVKADFTGRGWDHRGKLDVPKERFISYPGAERETDASAVVGSAAWSDLDRARALAAWYLQARRDGRDAEHLIPLLAGLAELVPWLKQWYDEPSPDPALDRPGTQIAALVDTELRSLSLTHDDLTLWRPEKKRARRVRKAAT